MANWCDLPQELLYLISLLLTSSIDFLRFRSVCTTWRASVQPRLCPASTNHVIPSPDSRRYPTFSLAKLTTFSVQSPNNHYPLWIIKLGRRDIHSKLYHPHSGTPINKLPQNIPRPFSFLNLNVKELGEEYFTPDLEYKATVLKRLDNTSVLTIVQSKYGELHVYNSGNEEWRVIENVVGMRYCDVILMGGTFYAVSSDGRLVRIDHIDLSLEIVVSSPVLKDWDNKFLVECNGNLLLVNVCYSDYNYGYFDYDCDGNLYPVYCYSDSDSDEEEAMELSAILERPFRAKVFRIDENAGKWVEVNDLGDMILFVRYRSVFSASAKDIFGETETATYGKGNCIFHYEGNLLESYGVQVYDLKTGISKYFDNQTDSTIVYWPPPAWAYAAANH